MKKEYLIVFLFLLALSHWGCNKNETEGIEPEPLVMKGQWVESQDKTDTIEFLELGPNSRMFELRRGREIRNGISVPKLKSGPYDYYLPKADTITVKWLFSSNASASNHYFKWQEDELRIGDFYGKNSSGTTILTFKRVK